MHCYSRFYTRTITASVLDPQPPTLNEPPNRIFYDFLSVVHVTEDFLPQHHESPVHPRPVFRDVLDAGDDATALHSDEMEAGPRFHTHKAGDVLAILERFNDCRERYVRKAIGIVGKEHLLSFKLPLHSFQALTNVRGKPCVHKCDVPVIDVATQ